MGFNSALKGLSVSSLGGSGVWSP